MGELVVSRISPAAPLERADPAVAGTTWHLQVTVETYRAACDAGYAKEGCAFLVATTRLIGLQFLGDVTGGRPCLTFRGELALAWWQFRRAKRALERHGVITPIWPSEVRA